MPMKMFIKRTAHEFENGAVCIRGQLGGLVAADVDWRPGRLGVCAWIRFGRRIYDGHNVGWVAVTLDWFDPMGEPNRLYVFGPRWDYMIGLPDNREDVFSVEDGVSVFREVRGRWRLVRGQRWSRARGWDQDLVRFSWFVRSPRRM